MCGANCSSVDITEVSGSNPHGACWQPGGFHCNDMSVPRDPLSPEASPVRPRGDGAPYLGGLCEVELRVLHQALQGHCHVDHLHLLALLALVIDKLPVPGVDDDEACRWLCQQGRALLAPSAPGPLPLDCRNTVPRGDPHTHPFPEEAMPSHPFWILLPR